MEIAQLSSFYQIVKTGSFSEASEKVFLSQSAVSHQITNLENELNVKLFKRIGKKTKLTNEGEILFEKTINIFNDLEGLKRIYADIDSGVGGKLMIAATSAVVTYVLPKIIKKFVDRFPKISFKLFTCGYISELTSLVLDGDFGIGLGSQLENLPRLNFLLWKSFDMCLIVSKKHPLSQKKRIKLVDIAKYPHILYGKRTVNRRVIDEVYLRHNIKPEIIMEVDMAENIKSYVEKDIGLGIISSVSITKRDRERLFISNSNHLFGQAQFGIYYRKAGYISSATKQFIGLFAPELLNNLSRLSSPKKE